jgi:CheY-like chemotaxis protein
MEIPGIARTIREPAVDLAGTRLLVVDDNELNRVIAREALERAGARVETAADGEAAIDRLRIGGFDIVLMDLQMPGVDGYTAARRIRSELGIPSSALPILAITASAAPDEWRRVADAGIDDLILKPCSPELLRRRIAAHLRVHVVPTAPRAEPLRCVIIDGGDVAGAVLRQYVQRQPYLRLLAAHRSVAGAASHPGNGVDLVYLDIDLPEPGGLELICRLQPRAGVIIVTAWPDRALAALRPACPAAGVATAGWLLKPIDHGRFLRATLEAGRRHTAGAHRADGTRV